MLTMRAQMTVLFALVTPKMDYDILDDGKPIAVVSYLKNKGGEIKIDGKQYPLVRGGGPSEEVLGGLLIRVLSGRKKTPATYTMTDTEGRTLFFAEFDPKEGFAVSRGEAKYRFRMVKEKIRLGIVKEVGHKLFREGDEQPLRSNEGMSATSEFDLLFQVFLQALAAARLEEKVDGSAPSPF